MNQNDLKALRQQQSCVMLLSAKPVGGLSLEGHPNGTGMSVSLRQPLCMTYT